MANPTPVYRVEFDGDYLPGYVQTDDRPLSFRNVESAPIGRDGSTIKRTGANMRDITLSFLVRTELGNDVTGIENLENIMDQYRDALDILTRPDGEAELIIHDTDRYYLATVETVSAPLSNESSTRLIYTVRWTAQPWAYGATQSTDTFTGNDTVSLTVSSVKTTYPVFTIPSGVTAFTATAGGRSLIFARGSFSGTITIDCGALTAVTAGGVNAINTIDDLNFGLRYAGAGPFNIVITGFAGSGTVTVGLRDRYVL